MSRPTRGPRRLLPVRGCHPLWPTVPDRSGSTAMTTGLVRFRSPLLAESRLMSSPPANEMFQFAGFASCTYEFSAGSPKGWGCPIRKSTDQRVLAPPRGLSQRATSFIASQCQGIHQMPLICSIQSAGPTPKDGTTTPGTPPRTGANPKCPPACQPSRCYPLDQWRGRRGSCSAHSVFP